MREVELAKRPEPGMGAAPEAWRRRAATTRRTMTAKVSISKCRFGVPGTVEIPIRVCPPPPPPRFLSFSYGVVVSRTCKSLFHIHHLSRTGLHKPTVPPPRPLEPLPARYGPGVFQIALIPRHDFDRLNFLCILTVLTFHVDHLHKVIERSKGRVIGNVVDEEEGIGAEIRCRP